MTTYQNNSNVLVAVRRETTVGVGATVTGANRIRIIGSGGLELKRGTIKSVEKRVDALESMGRLGGKTVDGAYTSELTVGGATDVLAEAIMRSAWVTAVAIGFATMTTVALGSNTITAAGGDWINTQGIRVGDILTISGTSVSADNNINVPVLAVTTLTITTLAAAFTTLAASATGTITLAKKLKNGATPTRYTHTVEQYDEDIGLSEIFLGCRCIGMKLSCKPNAIATVQWTFMGMDRTALSGGSSPYFTTPAVTTGLALIADDATIRKNGATVANFTGFDLTFSIAAKTQPVLGTFVSPDVFDNDMSVSGTIMALRSDFSDQTLYDAETEFEVSILLQELAAAPKPFFNIFIPRVKLSALTAPVGGTDGAKVVTLGLMVAPKVAATGYDATVATISSSAP